jgi:hypothetical protein
VFDFFPGDQEWLMTVLKAFFQKLSQAARACIVVFPSFSAKFSVGDAFSQVANRQAAIR